MKTIITLLCLLALAGAGTYMKKWKEFMTENGKTYNNTVDEIVHFSSFIKNLKMIEEHNERYRSGLETYEMEMNQYTDFTETELLKLARCAPKRQEKKRNLPPSYELLLHFYKQYLPESVDWRKEGAVTRVKDQGDCGSCWAFSAVGAVEGQLFRKEGKLVELSEQNLLDCTRSYGNFGCDGGWQEYSFQYIKENGGINTEESYPYEGIEGECRFDRKNTGAVIKGYKEIGSGNEETLARVVADVGPVAASIYMSPKWAFYKKGVFYDRNCNKAPEVHAVLVVGYGSENGQDYWMVKNSWDTTFGDQGYIKMARNRNNNCGIASFGSFPVL